MRPEFKDRFDPVEIAGTYKEHGAAAVSVLTDQEFFQGHLDHLARVKDHVGLPALNKEFMIEDVQFYEARAYGADAVLLIVAALDRIQLEDFYTMAKGLALDVLVETHDESEIDMVLETNSRRGPDRHQQSGPDDLLDRSFGYPATGPTDSFRENHRE